MNVFFSYYGGKWLGARCYGPPRQDLVIEPFAGGAGYSTYWSHPNVKLYDLNPQTCAAWDWIINCTAADVMAVPDEFRSLEELNALPDGPRQVVGWNIAYATGGRGTNPSIPKWYWHYVETGEKIGRLATHSRSHTNSVALMWGPRIKHRIVKQKPLIAKWSITQCSYIDIPLEHAHWHVDPPYQGKPGRGYLCSDIDFKHLGEWCRSLPGSVDVCENAGADWLDFKPLFSRKSMNSLKQSNEVVWRNEPVELTDLMQ